MTRCPAGKCAETITQPPLCGEHTRLVTVGLVELPSYYVQLALAMVPGSTVSERVSTSRTYGLPINVTARMLQEDMCALVRDAERDYRRAKGWSPTPRRGREGRALSLGVVFLARNLPDLLVMSWGVDVAVDILRLVRTSRHVLGLDRLIHKLPAPCPSCDLLTLEREDGANQVICRSCGNAYSEDEYVRLTLILTSGSKK